MAVFVLDKKKRPLMPCSEKRARKLLEKGRAVVHRLHPFTIRLKDRLLKESKPQPTCLKIDPGCKVTGFALVRESHILHLSELEQRKDIKGKMERRRGYRRLRRSKLRYRSPRFLNRYRSKGWLAPTVRGWADNMLGWVKRYQRLSPIEKVFVEVCKFDFQNLQNPEISGVEYQRGELFGYEVREYLLEKLGRRCSYCGKEGVPLQIDHIFPKSRGGTDRVSNLTLACKGCNQRKGSQTAEEFGYPEIQGRGRETLKGASHVNGVRYVLVDWIRELGLVVEEGSGGKTRYNRERLGIAKGHSYDAACVGETEELIRWDVPVMEMRVVGRGR